MEIHTVETVEMVKKSSGIDYRILKRTSELPTINGNVHTLKLPENVAVGGPYVLNCDKYKIFYFIGKLDFMKQFRDLVHEMQWSKENMSIVGDHIILQQPDGEYIHICAQTFPSIRKLMAYLEIPSSQIIYYRNKWMISELATEVLRNGVNVIANRLTPRNELKLFELYNSFGIAIPSDCEYLELCNLKISKNELIKLVPHLCPHAENLLTLFGYSITRGYNINYARYNMIEDGFINVDDLKIDNRAAFESLSKDMSATYLLHKMGCSFDKVLDAMGPFDNSEQIFQEMKKKLDEMKGKQIPLLSTPEKIDTPYEKYYPIKIEVHTICAICQTNIRRDGLGIATLRCGHSFHRGDAHCGGIKKLVGKNCPYCRQSF